MRLVLVNNHYFVHGGPDRYFFNVKSELERRDHTVIPFCFDYDETLQTEYRTYFPEPITGRGTYLLANLKLSRLAKAKAALRMFHNPDVSRRFRRLMQDERPDLVYSIYLSSTMLPNILRIAKREFGTPVLYRLSDFHMLCPTYLFFREGRICTECTSSKLAVVKHHCVKGSRLASILRLCQMQWVRLRRWYDAVDCFVCPSRFMRKSLAEFALIPEERLLHLPTFGEDLAVADTAGRPQDRPYALHFGRLTAEKGVDVLLRAYAQLPECSFDLRLVGHAHADYRIRLAEMLSPAVRHRVHFVQPKQGKELAAEIKHAAFTIMPVLWFDNMPNTAIESLSAGKPIVASNLGSLPELVQHEHNGLLFEPGDVQGLSTLLRRMEDADLVNELSRNARRSFETTHSADVHMEALLARMHACLDAGDAAAGARRSTNACASQLSISEIQ